MTHRGPGLAYLAALLVLLVFVLVLAKPILRGR